MKIIGIILALLVLSGCAELSIHKVDSDGYYRFKNLPISKTVSVWAPSVCISDMSVYESGNNTVDFVKGRGYWPFGGQYTLYVQGRKPDTTIEIFYKKAEEMFPHFTENFRSPDEYGINLVFHRGYRTKVSGRPAYQGLSISGDKAIFIATVILFEESVTFASLLYPLDYFDEKGPISEPEKEIPWDCYNKFVKSINIQ